jgi:hypothetical protein
MIGGDSFVGTPPPIPTLLGKDCPEIPNGPNHRKRGGSDS